MVRTRPLGTPLGFVAALLLLSLPWPAAALDNVEKGSPPPGHPIAEESLIEAVPEPNPRRATELAAEAEVDVRETGPDAELLEILASKTLDADDLPELIEAFRARIRASRAESDLPLGDLTRDLEQARLDVERLAELLLRKENAEVQQRAAQAQAEEQIGWLAQSLETAEQHVTKLLVERDDMERLAGESAARVDDLAQSLIEADEERHRLEQSLETSLAGAEETRRALAEASRRINDTNQAIASIEAASQARLQAYEQQEAAAEARIRDLEDKLRAKERTADALIATREAEIQQLAQLQAEAREVLTRALAEFDEATEARNADQARELLRQAQVSSEARVTALAEMGFHRDEQGNLVPPEVVLAEGLTEVAAIEPAAGPACLADAEQVARPYLDDEAAANRNHYLMGTIHFTDTAAQPDGKELAAIVACLEELTDNAAFYFRVIGHTDSRGAQSSNERLSLERAETVRDSVASEVTVQPWRLMVQGRGPDFPIADNDTAEGQAINRRVEVFAIETRL